MVVPGPAISSYRSPGLHAVFEAVGSDRSCRVLDLGPAVADNVAFISSFAEVQQIVDVFGEGFAGGSTEYSAVERGLETLRTLCRTRRRSFHLVFTWDLFDYLPETTSREVLKALSSLCRPAALLHTIFHSTDTMPDLPSRYRILGNDRLAYESVTSDRRGAPNLPPASVEKLLGEFHIEHSFVLRHGVREYVASLTGPEV